MGRATIIGPGTRVPGPLHSRDDVEIEGTIEGDVVGEARVVLHPTASVRGTVRGREVVIGGRLCERVIASEGVRLLKTAELRGDVEAPRISIEDGAVFEGQVRMTRTARHGEGARAPAVTPRQAGPAVSQHSALAGTTPPESKVPAAPASRAPAPTRDGARPAPELSVPGRTRLQRRTS